MYGSSLLTFTTSLLTVTGFLIGPAAAGPGAAVVAPERGPTRVVARCADGFGTSSLVTDRTGVSTATWGCRQRVYAARTGRDGTWQGATAIGTGLEPQAVVDLRGRVTVLFRGLHGNGMQSARWAGGRWQPPVDITWPTAADEVFVQWASLTGNARGDVLATWTQNDGPVQSGPRPQLVVAYRPFDGTWARTVRLAPGYGTPLMAGVGRAMVIGRGGIFRRTAEGRWRDPVPIPVTDRLSGLAVDASGDLLAINHDTATGDLLAREKPVGSPWSPLVEFASSPWERAQTPVLLWDTGRAVVAYADATVGLSVVTRRADGVWMAPVAVSAPHVGAGHPRIARGRDGTLAVIWTQGGELWVSLQPAAGSWSTPVRLAGSPWKRVSHMTVTLLPGGSARIAWTGRWVDHGGWTFASREVSLPAS